MIIGIVGNKNDLFERREVEFEEGKKFSEENHALFFEVSAKNYESIENMFLTLCELYLDKEYKKAIKKGKK